MANVQYDFNPIDWTGFSVNTVVLDEGYVLWFKNHPDGAGYCQVIGDGSSVVSALTPLFASGPKYLSSGRKFADEKRTDLGSQVTGWVTIAETDAGVVVPACSGRGSVMTNNGYGIAFEYSLRPYSAGMTAQNNTLKIISQCDTIAGFGTNIAGVRAAYSASDTSGIKLQVNVITEQILNVQLNSNLGRENGYTGLKFSTATTTDIDKTPSGATASFLEAGAEYDASISVFPIPGQGIVLSDDSAVFTFPFGEIPKQNLSAITITDPSVGWIFTIGGTTVTGSLTGFTASNIAISGNNCISFRWNKVGAFTGHTGKSFVVRTNGTGGKFTLS